MINSPSPLKCRKTINKARSFLYPIRCYFSDQKRLRTHSRAPGILHSGIFTVAEARYHTQQTVAKSSDENDDDATKWGQIASSQPFVPTKTQIAWWPNAYLLNRTNADQDLLEFLNLTYREGFRGFASILFQKSARLVHLTWVVPYWNLMSTPIKESG